MSPHSPCIAVYGVRMRRQPATVAAVPPNGSLRCWRHVHSRGCSRNQQFNMPATYRAGILICCLADDCAMACKHPLHHVMDEKSCAMAMFGNIRVAQQASKVAFKRFHGLLESLLYSYKSLCGSAITFKLHFDWILATSSGQTRSICRAMPHSIPDPWKTSPFDRAALAATNANTPAQK